MVDLPIPTSTTVDTREVGLPWWRSSLATGVVATGLGALVVTAPHAWWPRAGTLEWWVATLVLHLPALAIALFLVGGFVERVGYLLRGRRGPTAGTLPMPYPTVCVQLPMFNEHEVAARAIKAACALEWPHHRLSVQVLDDSTDAATRELVDSVCAEVRRTSGVECHVVRRGHREGFKAGALEVGRRMTDAEFIAIFDADFVPPADFLLRAIRRFHDCNGRSDRRLSLVQARWGHLNADESPLTRAQSLWVDDHHTLQMSWRSVQWQFVNFTGTAGVWRASAIAEAGGWRAASLVEDCELSFRSLFAGHRTTFDRHLVAPAELPATYTAYKAQQRRWTQGWVQLQRLHLRTLMKEYPASPLRRLHLGYHMCVALQWPLWAVWVTLFPLLITTGLWFGAGGVLTGVVIYLAPTLIWLVTIGVLATVETGRHGGDPSPRPPSFVRGLARIVPYMAINTAMLPHQFSAFCEGLFGPMHSEFERTPKAAAVVGSNLAPPTPSRSGARAPTRASVNRVRIHRPYVAAEMWFVAYQTLWAVVFAFAGLWWCAVGAMYLATSVVALVYRYGDHLGLRCFGLVRPRTRTRVDCAGDPSRPSGSSAAATEQSTATCQDGAPAADATGERVLTAV
jgi:cellulose synthase/poly-beta-1,6-N-acetylglucosamine synthase-like glycosyltransferase